jgi:hypothetical protein
MISPDQLRTARESKAMPSRLIEGDPSYKTWELDNLHDGRLRSGSSALSCVTVWKAGIASRQAVSYM